MCAFVSWPEACDSVSAPAAGATPSKPSSGAAVPTPRCRGKTLFSHVRFFAYLIVFNAVRGGLVYVFWRKTLMFNLILIPNCQIGVGLLLCHRSR